MNEVKETMAPQTINKSYCIFLFHCMHCFTMERMMAPAMVNMMLSVIEQLYPGDREKQIEVMMEHCSFFNTQPTLGTIAPGIVLALEHERAKSGEISGDMIQGIKTAVAAPFAGIGDSLIQGLLLPILLSIGIGLSAEGSPVGVIFAVVGFFLVCIPASYLMFKAGVNLGISGAQKILSSKIKDTIIESFEILGIIVVGALTANMIQVNCGLSYTNGELSISVAEILDSILPGLIPMGAGVLVYYLIKYKKWSSLKIMLLLLAVAVVGYFTNIVAQIMM